MKARSISSFLILVAFCSAFNILSVRYETTFADDDWNFSRNSEDDGWNRRSVIDTKSKSVDVNGSVPIESSWEVDTASRGDKEETLSSSNSLLPSPHNNSEQYEVQVHEALTPLTGSEISTVANVVHFAGGLCNQIISLIGAIFVAETGEHKFDQILEESIPWKDMYGTNHRLLFHHLFDVVHWNTFYPLLPYIKRHNAGLHPQFKIREETVMIDGLPYPAAPRVNWNVTGDPIKNATRPFAMAGKRGMVWNQYKIFARKLDSGRMKGLQEQHDIHKTILQGALRPHPEIQQMIQQYINIQLQGEKYMVLHARIEPDMNKHPMCKNRKVVNVTNIFDMIEHHYPEPPVKKVLLTFNRAILEKEASVDTSGIDNNTDKDIHTLAVHNLKAINEAMANGLWNGRVKVFEDGTTLVEKVSQNPFYKYYSSITGAIVNLFLNIQSNIFIGTEVSSFSTIIANARFYRGQNENFFYR